MSISATFRRMLTVTAGTKRTPDFTGTKRGEADSYLADLKVSQLLPISRELMERAPTNSPYALFECCCDGDYDIQSGDILVVKNRDYPIRFVEDYGNYLVLMLEDLRNKQPA